MTAKYQLSNAKYYIFQQAAAAKALHGAARLAAEEIKRAGKFFM